MPGLIAPLININGYSYRRVLEKTNLLNKFEEKFGKAVMDATPGEKILTDGEVAKFLWGNDNEELKDIDKISEKFLKGEFKYSASPIRFSIGAILMPREIWNSMGPVIVSENVLVGHFSYGPQTSAMKEYYKENKDIFRFKK